MILEFTGAARRCFTAPEDGLFFASITMDTATADEVDVLVVKEGQGVRDVVIKGGASVTGTCACGTAVFPMLNGQTLYVKCIGSGGSRVLSCCKLYLL
ncbi:hypothetical protein Btru_044168 [Bulinus truncatus]|nr:hypothetical protein Btru_044168 [Bulinus truncatus]